MSQIWFERILRWRKKAQRFLQGRYARFDELNRTLLLTSVVLALINIFTGYLCTMVLYTAYNRISCTICCGFGY